MNHFLAAVIAVKPVISGLIEMHFIIFYLQFTILTRGAALPVFDSEAQTRGVGRADVNCK
jgi:hypothetical protein